MATARQSKGPRKGPADAPVSRNSPSRPPAWGTGARASPTFSSAGRQPSQQPPAPPAIAPQPQPNGTRSDSAPPRDRVLQALSGLTGTTITLLTKSAQRYEGVIDSTSSEGDMSGITLKDVKEVTNPGAPLKDSLFIPATNIDSYNSGPADAKPTNGDSFRTDTDISQKKPVPGRERDLQAWVPSGGDAHPALSADDDMFAPSNGTAWDQFSVNEQLFGVKGGFDEDLYTTKLDRAAPDFKERERKAQKIANEIIGVVSSNPHVAEERGIVIDDSGANEEEKYGAVVRGQNAYVPPGARKGGPLPPSQPATVVAGETVKADAIPKVSINGPDGSILAPTQTPAVKTTTSTPGATPTVATNPPADAVPAFRQFVTNEKQRLTQKRQALVKSDMDKRMAELVKFSQSFKLNKPMPDDLVPILAKDEERQRQIKEKAEKDASSGLARAIGPSTPATASRGLPVAGAKVVERKPVSQALVGKGGAAGATSVSGAAPVSGGASAQKTLSAANAAASSSSSGATMAAAVKPAVKPVSAVPSSNGKKISMVIQSIPPFKGPKTKHSASASTSSASATPQASGAGANGTPVVNAPVTASKTGIRAGGVTISPAAAAPSPISPNTAAANRLNINASSFRPNPKANAFNPVVTSPKNGPGSNQNVPTTTPVTAANTASPKVKTESASGTPNQFFGTRVIKKSTPVHVKDDFNPFKHNKVVDASHVSAIWPYNGKRYMQMFPPPQHPPAQHGAHMQPPVPTPMPPPSYEEDSAAQAAQQQHRGYVYYPPYGYPPQHMMPGMPPPGPPGAYMPGPYMQHMPYPPGMPPPNAMYSPVGQMPPYMQPPPPGAYPPPPNGAGPRPSMPPTPIPAHAHPYYHQSPQLPHAYPMMMAPPPNIPPHGYEGGPAPPVPMGGHA